MSMTTLVPARNSSQLQATDGGAISNLTADELKDVVLLGRLRHIHNNADVVILYDHYHVPRST